MIALDVILQDKQQDNLSASLFWQAQQIFQVNDC